MCPQSVLLTPYPVLPENNSLEQSLSQTRRQSKKPHAQDGGGKTPEEGWEST